MDFWDDFRFIIGCEPLAEPLLHHCGDGIVLGTTRMLGRRDDGPPVYTYEAVPGVPPVSTMRLGRGSSEVRPGAHSHDFLVLAYVERGGGSMWLGEPGVANRGGRRVPHRPWRGGGSGDDASGLHGPEGWAVFFQPEVLGSEAPGAFLSWRAHPLLFPFVRGAAGGAQRLSVPQREALVL